MVHVEKTKYRKSIKITIDNDTAEWLLDQFGSHNIDSDFYRKVSEVIYEAR